MINITIVGGGSAGWMTATTLLNQFPNKKITLVESSNISNIGVGESTVPGINRWLKLVDIDFLDFMPHTDSVFKLSIAFKDWYRKNSGTFHYPFGPSRHQYVKFGTKELHEIELTDWHLKKIFYPETPVSDYAEWFYPSMALINQNKYFPNQSDLDRGELDSEHAYQFDATKFGMWLRDTYCNTNSNFTHILGEVEETPLNDNGIKYLLLDDGRRLEADLFIDCTGFKGILISDDILMKALRYGLKNNAIRALDAGCNLILHCNGNIREMSKLTKIIPKIDKFTQKKTSDLYKFLG